MRKGIAAIVVVLAAVSTQAASRNPHLVPEEGVFSALFPEYYLAVRKALLEGVSGEALRVATLPSFEPEWAAWVETKPAPRTCSRVVTTKIWNGMEAAQPHDPGGVPAPVCAPLELTVANTIELAWLEMLRGTRYPEPSNVVGFDGVSYHFAAFIRGYGDLEGQTWSPDPDTATGRLVALAEALRAYSLSPSSEAQQRLCQLANSLLPTLRRLTSVCS